MLGGHHVVRASICLAGDDRDLGHRGLSVRVQQLRAVADDAAVLLHGAGQEAGNVHEGEDGDVEGVQEAHEAGGLHGRVDVQAASQVAGVVGHNTNSAALHARETADDVLGVVGHDLGDHSLVHHLLHHLQHVVRNVGVIGHLESEALLLSVSAVVGGARLGLVLVVQGQVVEDLAHAAQGNHVVLERTVRHTGDGGVGVGAAKHFLGHVLLGHGLHHVGASHEHVRRVLHHEDEVRHSGTIDGATSAGAHDQRQLGDHTRSVHVLQEHVRVTAQTVHALLDSGSAGVVETDDGGTDSQGHVHHLADLLGVGLPMY
eukprot:Colp12_sorted_trinity150504_noHs@3106